MLTGNRHQSCMSKHKQSGDRTYLEENVTRETITQSVLPFSFNPKFLAAQSYEDINCVVVVILTF